MKKFFGFLLAFLIFAAPVFGDYPNPKGYVNDFAGVIPDQTEQKIEKMLSDYDKKTTNQITVATIKTTGDETIEEFSINLAEKWKIGQKNKDNGLLMLFAMDDRNMRIEVGRGLEGDVTDLEAKYILRDIEPYFKKGDYPAGIEYGVNSIIASIDTTYKPLTPPDQNNDLEAIIFIIILIIIIYSIAYSPLTPFGGQGIWGTPVLWGKFPHKDGGNGPFGGFGGGTFSGGGSSHKW